MRTLYPEIQPFNHFELPVESPHVLYVEECGNPEGQPILFVHGGPGGGCDDKSRRFFDPKAWRIVLFDQRGCGRSRPFAETASNTTGDLVGDIERIREHLGIKQWALFGGSWGSTLSLVYAQAHPDRVSGLILRGIFLARPTDLDWFYYTAAPQAFAEHYADFLAPVAPGRERDLVNAYHELLNDDDAEVRGNAAKAWSTWEARCSTLRPDESLLQHFGDDKMAVPMARLETHYFVNRCFLDENQILENMRSITHLPAHIVQGRYDMVCPPGAAFELHSAWPGSRLRWVDDAGHAATEPGITSALVEASDALAACLEGGK